MNSFVWVVIITAIAGICGTGFGGAVGAILRRDSSKSVSLLLAFAGGIMTAVVCFEMIPEAFHPDGAEADIPIPFVILGVLFGYIVIYLVNAFIDKRTNPQIGHIDDSHPKTADALDELIHSDHYEMHKKEKARKNPDLFIAGMVMATAIALHNFPEGMVIGTSFAADSGVITGGAGLIVAIIIGLHNIPEGMSVSVPLISGGMKPYKAILISALSGIPTVLGAIFGYFLGMISPLWLSLSLSFAGGAMLYVVFGELLPESFLMWKSKAPALFAVIGILVGCVLVHV